MPIRPSERARYPANWPQVAQDVKDAAKWVCEGSPKYPDCAAVHGHPHPVTGSTVVLTVAHLDHQPENVDRANLKAWCQRCHLTYDAAHHAATAAATRAAKRATGDLFTPEGVDHD
jgi:glutathione S-transferase